MDLKDHFQPSFPPTHPNLQHQQAFTVNTPANRLGEPANEDFAPPSSPPNPILELHPYFYNKITATAILPHQTTSPGNPPDLPFLTTLSTLVALFQAPTPEAPC